MANLTLVEGYAKFLNLDEVQVETRSGKKPIFEPSNVIIATGSHFARNPEIPYDGARIFDPESIFSIETLPKSMIIYGSQVVPMQFAIVFALLGVEVTLVTEESVLIPKIDTELEGMILERLEMLGVRLKFDVKYESVLNEDNRVVINMEDGSALETDSLLWLNDRYGNTEKLECHEAGLEADYYGNIKANDKFQTSVGHIYAVGDVVKNTIFESHRRAQGREATGIIFGLKDTEQLSENYPVGVYAFPEIAFYGMTESEARARSIPIVIGRADYRDTPYGRLCSMNDGMLKIVVNRDTQEILGAHIIGRAAQEIVHFGMQLIEDKVRVSRLIGSIFNGGTLHELYVFAARMPMKSCERAMRD